MAGTRFILPIRFLTLVAHFLTVINCSYTMKANIEASLPLRYTQEDYEDKRVEYAMVVRWWWR